jgi:hypothetical protein
VAVLELARLLAQAKPPHSVVFALWDTEETGLHGSRVYATRAREEGEDIIGAINLDMIGWDGDGDRVVEIHSNNESAWLAEFVRKIVSRYDIELKPGIILPGTPRSDQKSFWDRGYEAILLIEEMVGGDFNPYYHSPSDQIVNVDPSYLASVTQLALAAAGELAMGGRTVAVSDDIPLPSWGLDPPYPNPVVSHGNVTIRLQEPGLVSVSVTDILGRPVTTLLSGFQRAGERRLTWHPSAEVPNGVYFAVLETPEGRQVRPLHIVR